MDLFISGMVLGYLVLNRVMAIGERRGWEFSAQIAIAGVVMMIAMIPLVLLVKLIERALS